MLSEEDEGGEGAPSSHKFPGVFYEEEETEKTNDERFSSDNGRAKEEGATDERELMKSSKFPHGKAKKTILVKRDKSWKRWLQNISFFKVNLCL